LAQTGATLDGIVAKRLDLDYRSGERDGMQKIKNFRSADCVVGGFRYGTKTKVVGSLLVGLYDADGLLQHVGFTSSIAVAGRPALTKKLEKLIGGHWLHRQSAGRAEPLECGQGYPLGSRSSLRWSSKSATTT
jgi:ATP-dependent DNA ligase